MVAGRVYGFNQLDGGTFLYKSGDGEVVRGRMFGGVKVGNLTGGLEGVGNGTWSRNEE